MQFLVCGLRRIAATSLVALSIVCNAACSSPAFPDAGMDNGGAGSGAGSDPPADGTGPVLPVTHYDVTGVAADPLIFFVVSAGDVVMRIDTSRSPGMPPLVDVYVETATAAMSYRNDYGDIALTVDDLGAMMGGGMGGPTTVFTITATGTLPLNQSATGPRFVANVSVVLTSGGGTGIQAWGFVMNQATLNTSSGNVEFQLDDQSTGFVRDIVVDVARASLIFLDANQGTTRSLSAADAVALLNATPPYDVTVEALHEGSVGPTGAFIANVWLEILHTGPVPNVVGYAVAASARVAQSGDLEFQAVDRNSGLTYDVTVPANKNFTEHDLTVLANGSGNPFHSYNAADAAARLNALGVFPSEAHKIVVSGNPTGGLDFLGDGLVIEWGTGLSLDLIPGSASMTGNGGLSAEGTFSTAAPVWWVGSVPQSVSVLVAPIALFSSAFGPAVGGATPVFSIDAAAAVASINSHNGPLSSFVGGYWDSAAGCFVGTGELRIRP